ncbi:unnamed protein product [Brassicogethes aeneus]|uniref:MADF domain-containing protein n=1 Tax=Brassicogethes aeneus TaxID=1431903 RepID=A0A9P0BCZ0_BRAAE|nr:unnamed protein product [Brassicogethes aeneus]
MALFAIIHMLPPTAKGKTFTSRPSLEQLFERLVQFCKIAEPLEEITSKKQGHQRYLIAIGANKAAVHDYKVSLDGKFLETGTSCVQSDQEKLTDFGNESINSAGFDDISNDFNPERAADTINYQLNISVKTRPVNDRVTDDLSEKENTFLTTHENIMIANQESLIQDAVKIKDKQRKPASVFNFSSDKDNTIENTSPQQGLSNVKKNYTSVTKNKYDLEKNLDNTSDSGSEFDPNEEESTFSSSDNIMSSDDSETIERNQLLKQERENWKGRPKKGRKTKYPGQTFKIRKQLKNSNKTHYTVKGKLVKGKEFTDFNCNCSLKCTERLPINVRQNFFEKFWALGSYETQTTFIAATVKQEGVKRKRNLASVKRSFTRTYKFNDAIVCRNMFIKTLQISTKRVDTALKKFYLGNIQDGRGKFGCVNKQLPEDTKAKVITHIASFPTYVSHYCRNSTESRFLPMDLTLNKMYELYKAEPSNPKVAFSTYKKMFYLNFNLRRKPPIKDTCNHCDKFVTKLKNSNNEVTLEIKALHDQHLDEAKQARVMLKSDLLLAAENGKVETLTYDMEKVLGLPKLPTNIIYYKRQLSIYNEGIYKGSNNESYCFVWKEGIAGRGAQEVGSCLKFMIDKYVAPEVEHLILWSDSCGGQNRNIKIVLFLKTVLESHQSLKSICFKYLVPGHSYLPNDSDFGKIERALKNQLRVYTLQEFKNIVLSCSKKRKFVVHEMEKEEFLSTEDLEKLITNRKTDTKGEESIRRWKSLRDRFTRELKKENLPSGSGAKNHPTWDLLTNLDFLRDHVAPRSTSGNMNPEVVSERPETEEETMEEATGQLEFEETCESPSYSSSGLSTPSTSGTQKKKKNKTGGGKPSIY